MQQVALVLAVLLLAFVAALSVLLLITEIRHLKWRVVFVPTASAVVEAMLDLARIRPGDTVVDLGAGDGRLLIAAKRREPTIRVLGYEGAPAVWILAKVRSWLARVPIDVRFQNFLVQDLSQADVLLLYLSPHVMELLSKKFSRELRPGTRIISHAFRLPGAEHREVREIPRRFGGVHRVYSYVWGER